MNRAADGNQQNEPDDVGMQHSDFRIGETFGCAGQRWRCTDVGTRVITAIKLDHEDDPSWHNGPPYALAEVVFDEHDIEGCSKDAQTDPGPLLGERGAAAAEGAGDDWFSPERKAKRIAQAQSLRDRARAGGLRFDAYLPPRLADWLLDHIERGTYTDPGEATFVMLGEQQELEPHADLRREFLSRRIQTAIADPHPAIPAEEVFQKLKILTDRPLPEAAVWKKLP